MKHSVTRRQVLRAGLTGGVAVASCAVTLSGPFATSLFAGAPPSTLLIGARVGSIPAGGPAAAAPLELQTMDLDTGQIQSRKVPLALPDGRPVLATGERIAGIAALRDTSLVVAIAPMSGSERAADLPRLLRFNGTSITTLRISGLARNEELANVVGSVAGSLLALAHNKNGTRPVRLMRIDPRTGAGSEHERLQLAPDKRFTRLTQGPRGQLYSILVADTGETSLVELDSGATRLLVADGKVWNNGFQSLLSAPTNQLLAVGAPRYETANALYDIDPSSGLMTRIRDFDVAAMALA